MVPYISSFGAQERLCCVIVAFPGYIHIALGRLFTIEPKYTNAIFSIGIVVYVIIIDQVIKPRVRRNPGKGYL